MFFTNDRDNLRLQFSEAWRRRRAGEALDGLAQQIAAVIEWHPEYHTLLEDERSLTRDFVPEGGQTNPYLHLSLHLAVRDQIGTDRPRGICALFAKLTTALGNKHAAEHVLLERLGEALWQAQRAGCPPDEAAYLAAVNDDLRRL